MKLDLGCSPAAFSLLKHRDDNFADKIIQYQYLPDDNTLQTYIVAYNFLLQLSSDWFKKLDNWKSQHRLIFEMDGIFRTYFFFLKYSNVIIDDNWEKIAKNMYEYIHSFWIESYGIDWMKLNNALIMCDKLSKNKIQKTNNIGRIYYLMRYSSDNGTTNYDVQF